MYESYYKLTGKPFQLRPDPAFYFASAGHRRAMAYLEYGIHQGEGFIVVTGDVGAGKTTLLNALLDKLPKAGIQAGRIVSTQLDDTSLLRMVATTFGLNPAVGADKATLLAMLEAYFTQLHANNRRAVLIVDEAQNLPVSAVEELRMLSNLSVGTTPLLQSFLVGQPEFRRVLQLPEMLQLRQRILASYHLGPLGEGETREYVLHRLRCVGWHEHPAIDDDAYLVVHEQSGGVPRRINRLMDRVLLANFLEGSAVVVAEMVRNVAKELEDELGNPWLAPHGGSAPADRSPVTPLQILADDDHASDLDRRLAGIEASLEQMAKSMKMMSLTLQRVLPQQLPD